MSNLYLNPILCWEGSRGQPNSLPAQVKLDYQKRRNNDPCISGSSRLCSLNAEHLNVSSFIIIVRGAGTRLSLGEQFLFTAH